MHTMLQKLREFDAYPKINEDFYKRSFSGGLITLISSIIMLLLFTSELRLYLHTVTETKLIVDTSKGGTLHINFDVTFPALPCALLCLDAKDISGEQHLDIRHDIFKTRIDTYGNVLEAKKEGIGAPKIEKPLQKHGGRLEHNEIYCGSCYGAETSDNHCCNSCEEVHEAYQEKGWALENTDLIDQCKREGFLQRVQDQEGEGCSVHGSVEVNRVAGSFHFVPGKAILLSDFFAGGMKMVQWENYNITHRINKLAFGDHFPGIMNPLDGAQWVHNTSTGMYQYFVKVVPTIYTDVKRHRVHSNQFSVTEHFRNSKEGHHRPIPERGVYFFYDLSPVKVTFTEKSMSFLHFMTNICAIIGGTFTVAGIIIDELETMVFQKPVRTVFVVGQVLSPLQE